MWKRTRYWLLVIAVPFCGLAILIGVVISKPTVHARYSRLLLKCRQAPARDEVRALSDQELISIMGPPDGVSEDPPRQNSGRSLLVNGLYHVDGDPKTFIWQDSSARVEICVNLYVKSIRGYELSRLEMFHEKGQRQYLLDVDASTNQTAISITHFSHPDVITGWRLWFEEALNSGQHP